AAAAEGQADPAERSEALAGPRALPNDPADAGTRAHLTHPADPATGAADLRARRGEATAHEARYATGALREARCSAQEERSAAVRRVLAGRAEIECVILQVGLELVRPESGIHLLHERGRSRGVRRGGRRPGKAAHAAVGEGAEDVRGDR